MATREHIDERAADISSEMESVLRSDLRENWFPRVIDRAGGYVENYDRKWRPTGDRARHLIHQARLAWTAAAYAEHDPDVRTEFAAHALHGIDFIDTVFRDRVHGGFYYDVALNGTPLRNGEKHICATAFAIFAAAKTYSVTRADRALELAREGFTWLDKRSYREGTGYVEALTRNGAPIMDRKHHTPLGDRYGDITSNTHLHLLEALAELYRVDPDPTIRGRLERVLNLILDRFVDDGSLLLLLDDRAQKASHGHGVETAYLLMDAAQSLGKPDDPKTWEVATRLAEKAFAEGRDKRHGGFFNEPTRDRGAKISWAQAEALNTWIMMDRRDAASGTRTWRDAIEEQWSFIKEHNIDGKHGGWFWQAGRRGWRSGISAKSEEWHDPYHTTRALINGSDRSS